MKGGLFGPPRQGWNARLGRVDIVDFEKFQNPIPSFGHMNGKKKRVCPWWRRVVVGGFLQMGFAGYPDTRYSEYGFN